MEETGVLAAMGSCSGQAFTVDSRVTGTLLHSSCLSCCMREH